MWEVGTDGQSFQWEITSGIPQGSALRSVMYVIFISGMENVLNSDVLGVSLTELSRIAKNKSLRSKMWKSLMILRDVAVKWQPAFDVNKHKIMHMGKNKPDCVMLKVSFRLSLTIRGWQLRVAVGNSKKCWLRAEQCSRKQINGQKLLGKTQRTK